VANGCGICHSTGDLAVVGPGLQGVYARAAARKPGLTADEYIAESVRTPSAYIVDGFQNYMVAFKLSDEQIADLIAYLKTLE
jgi:cytochrome c2